MTEEEPLAIDCDEHGKGVAATLCRHLTRHKGPKLGFIENSAVKNDYQAWCFACEYFFLTESEEKTAEFEEFCDFAIVCEKCYEIKKEHHKVDV